jgi:hypothetical protein
MMTSQEIVLPVPRVIFLETASAGRDLRTELENLLVQKFNLLSEEGVLRRQRSKRPSLIG